MELNIIGDWNGRKTHTHKMISIILYNWILFANALRIATLEGTKSGHNHSTGKINLVFNRKYAVDSSIRSLHSGEMKFAHQNHTWIRFEQKIFQTTARKRFEHSFFFLVHHNHKHHALICTLFYCLVAFTFQIEWWDRDKKRKWMKKKNRNQNNSNNNGFR